MPAALNAAMAAGIDALIRSAMAMMPAALPSSAKEIAVAWRDDGQLFCVFKCQILFKGSLSHGAIVENLLHGLLKQFDIEATCVSYAAPPIFEVSVSSW